MVVPEVLNFLREVAGSLVYQRSVPREAKQRSHHCKPLSSRLVYLVKWKERYCISQILTRQRGRPPLPRTRTSTLQSGVVYDETSRGRARTTTSS